MYRLASRFRSLTEFVVIGLLPGSLACNLVTLTADHNQPENRPYNGTCKRVITLFILHNSIAAAAKSRRHLLRRFSGPFERDIPCPTWHRRQPSFANLKTFLVSLRRRLDSLPALLLRPNYPGTQPWSCDLT
ncbi:hypothetical protein F4779DRAFT_339050 [Xylariaceae sp. FL0662B]|nr:hypothetical protein F4779DRAFT_339050 [Xylariaceae sp. FL0662B]